MGVRRSIVRLQPFGRVAQLGGRETDIAPGNAPRQFREARADGLGRYRYIVTSAAGGSPALSA